MILLDTHVLIWMDEGNKRLGRKTIKLLNSALADGNLTVSAVSFWEVSMLAQKGRLEILMEMDVWRGELIESGLNEMPLNGAIGIRAGGLQNFHGDPADRMIVATALETAATLVTADEKILSWKKLPQKHDARL
ncbi:type II toxin-antitoxin system VapC family toxin [Candidatus Pacearchaeota archaeon]|nr:type II toxin-antitoxin system VapC family toxin [Candidatus Pacearchaeota archaeon]